MAVSEDQVIQAVSTLFSPTSEPKLKEEANRWLEKFQKTPEAWVISDRLIRNNQIDLTIRTFSAQTLRRKIIYDIEELNLESKNQLKDSLVSLIQQHSSGPEILLRYLCLCLCDLALLFLDWKDVLSGLFQVFSNNIQYLNGFFEFLKLLPEEIHSNISHSLQREDYIKRSNEILTNQGNFILSFLLNCLNNQDFAINKQKKILECFHSWLKTGNIEPTALIGSPLLNKSFNAIQNDETFDISVEIICRILYETHDIKENLALIQEIYPYLIQLCNLLKNCKSNYEENEDQIKGICQIFTEAGENYLPLIVENFQLFHEILEGIILSTSFPDLNMISMTFNFWNSLSNYLLEPSHQHHIKEFHNIYLNLVDVILNHLKFPESEDWSAKEKEEFTDFRHAIGDVLKDCCLVLGSEIILLKTFNLLANELNVTPPSWQKIEAILFALRAIGGKIDLNENKVLPRIFELFEKLPPHSKVRYTAVLVIGRYTEWIREHPETIPFHLNYISTGFDDQTVIPASALALKFLCKDCKKLLIPYLPQLFPFYEKSFDVLIYDDVLEITEGLASIVSAVEPDSDYQRAVHVVSQPIINKLNQIIQQSGAQDLNNDSKTKLQQNLDLFSLFIDNSCPDPDAQSNEAISQLLEKFWPTLRFIQENHGNYYQVAESLCKLYHIFFTTYRKIFQTVLSNFLPSLVTAFEKTHLSSYIWISKKTIQEFGELIELNDELKELLNQLLSGISQAFLQFASNNNPANYPDVVEEYFTLLTSSLQDLFESFVSLPMYMTILQLSSKSLEITEYYALSGVINFLFRLTNEFLTILDKSENALSPKFQSAISHYFEVVPAILCHIFMGSLNNYSYDTIGESVNLIALILEICSHHPQFNDHNWIQNCLSQIPSDLLTDSTKNQFLNVYFGHLQRKDYIRLRRAIQDLIFRYRRRNAIDTEE